MKTNNAAHTPTVGPCWVSHSPKPDCWYVRTLRDRDVADRDLRDVGTDYGAILVSGIGDHTESRTRGNEEANANLIADAFNVYGETSLTPRQLAEQRVELLEALRIARSHIAATGWPNDPSGNYDKDGEWDFHAMTKNGTSADATEIKNAFQVLGDAIAKATGSAP